MEIIKEDKTIKYDYRNYYLFYNNGQMVGQVPAIVKGLDLEIWFTNNIVRLTKDGFIYSTWYDIDTIEIHNFIKED